MEYSTATANGVQPSYPQHPQDQTRISPGCNVQASGSTFPVSEAGSHNRTYSPYPQSYQSPHEYGGSQGSHPTPNSPTYPQMYPNEGHGQGLTLNQLLQQGNTTGSYQARPPGQVPYRTYDQFPYGYKPGLPVSMGDRSPVCAYPPYSNAPVHRYPDPYGRSPYSGYPPGPAYPYYQAPVAQQSPQRHQIASHISATDYPVAPSTTTSPRSTQLTPLAGMAPIGDRPSSRSMGPHGPAPPAASQLSSPVPSGGSSNMPSSNWSSHTPLFGSPQQANHGQSHTSQLSRSQSSGRESQQLKSLTDPSSDPHTSMQLDRPADCRPPSQTGESTSPIQSRLGDNGRPSTGNSSGSALRESSESQNGQVSTDSQHVPTDSFLVNPSGSVESSSPTGTSTFTASSTFSPVHVPRGTSAQSSASYSQPIPRANSPVSSQLNQPTNAQPSGVAGSQRLPGQSGQPFRSYGPPIQSPPGSRQPYSSCVQTQLLPQAPMHTVGSYFVGGRPPFYSGGGHPVRSMSTAPVVSSNAAGPPRIPGTPSHFSPQSGGPGMMPPPAAPPPNVSHTGPSGSSSASQMGFVNMTSYAPSNATGAAPYYAPTAASGSGWEPQPPSHLSAHSSGAPTSMAQQQQQQQQHPSYVQGRPSAVYTGPPERGTGYSSPQPVAPPTLNAGGAAGPLSQPPASSGAYHHSQIPPSYHSQGVPYSNSQSLYPPQPYPSIIGGIGGPTPPHQQPNHPSIPPAGTATLAPPPYPASALMTSGPSGLPTRDPFHTQYSHGVPQNPERGPPPYFGPVGSGLSSDPPVFSVASPSGSAMSASRVSSIGGGGGAKMSPCGMVLKGPKMEPGMRPLTPNNASILATSGSSHPGLTSGVSLGPTGATDEDNVAAQLSQQAQPTDCAAQHPVTPAMHHAFPPGYWPDGMVSTSQMSVPATGPHQFSPFQHQQQHYRPVVLSQMHPQYPHGLHNSVCGSIPTGSMYGGSMGSHNSGHMHSMAHGISPQSSSGFQKLLEMGSEPERRSWLEHYVRFMEDIGKPLVGLPQVVKQPLDLYRFYLAVRERGGVLEVIKTRRWKEISQLVNINASASAAYTLRKNYCKFLLDYECRFDRGGADPRPILMHIEAMSGKKKKASPGDADSGCGPNSSLCGSGLQIPPPPSPTGSHSSASSSLLPPGSGSASLSGVPTAGSVTSDSQLGPTASQSRHGDSCHALSGATLMDGTNGLSSSPTSSAISSSASFMPGTNASSPQRPSSSASVINGYASTPHSASDGVARSTVGWPWSSDAGPTVPATGASHYSPTVTMNGFPMTPPMRGPLSSHASQSPMGHTSHLPNSSVAPTTPNVPAAYSLSASTSVAPPNPTATPMFTKGTEPTVHHHAGPYPQQIPASGPPSAQLPSALPHHPQSPGHSVAPGPSQATLHPRVCMSMGVRPLPYGMGGGGAVPPGSTGTGDPVTLWCMQQFRSSAPGQMTTYPPGVMSSFQGAMSSTGANVPAHLVHHHGQRSGYVATILKRVEHHPFPPGTIEATQIEATRKRRYRAKDVGPIVPFKLLMALRSGMTAEVSWALNCLNILLRDDCGFEFLNSINLSVLITHLVDLWRHSLGEMFDHDLFVTSLELPADLSYLTRTSSSDVRLSNIERVVKHTLDSHTHGLHSKKSSSLLVFPNNLANLEQELISLAASQSISVASLRNGIRRLLSKTDASLFSFPTRVRNGLSFRIEPFSTSSTLASANPTIMSESSIVATSLRTRKRGKPINPGFPYSSASSISSSLSVTVTPCLSGTVSSLTTTPTPPGKSELCGASRVTTTSNYLGSPQSYSNLRELTKFVIDELVQSDVKSSSHSELRSNPQKKEDDVHECLPGSSVMCLRELISHGGGDTTCHIMPPYGALPFLSKHWCGDVDRFYETLTVEGDHASNSYCVHSSSTPPPVVLNEKCAPGDESRYEHEGSTEFVEEDDAQPYSKRTRHASTSSLSCPVLSPQPLDELPDTVDAKASPLHTGSDPDELKQGDRMTVHDTPDEEDNEFSQLVMDANGRCPLRAREELVHHGLTCLWPDDPETDSNEARAVRCLCVSTVLRNLSFINIAEHHLSTHKGVLCLIGRMMLLGHEHVGTSDTWQTVEVTVKKMEASSCAWRTPTWLEDMRENALVMLVNIAGYLDLIRFEETIVRPILGGLLHWIICPTAASTDPFPGHRTLSPRRLALEAINRLFVHQSNVDLLLSTPDSHDTALTKFFDRLANWLSLPEDQVTRELALSTMHYLTGGGISFGGSGDPMHGKLSNVDAPSNFFLPSNYIGTTMLAVAKPCPIAGLLGFIEAAEATTRRVIEQFGVQALQERPELMGTSLEMVRRAGALLDRLAADPTGRKRFTPILELRLMDLVTSRVLDATVAHLLCGALYRLSPPRLSIGKVVAPLVPPSPSLAVVTHLLKNSECKSTTDNSTDMKDSVTESTSSEKPQIEIFVEAKPQENGPSVSSSDDFTSDVSGIVSGDGENSDSVMIPINDENSHEQDTRIMVANSQTTGFTTVHAHVKSETNLSEPLADPLPLSLPNCVDS